jgi:hypothetical protein
LDANFLSAQKFAPHDAKKERAHEKPKKVTICSKVAQRFLLPTAILHSGMVHEQNSITFFLVDIDR